MAADFARKGEYKDAANLLKQYNNAMQKANLSSDPIYEAQEKQYNAIAQKGGSHIYRPQKNIKIPFRNWQSNSKSNLMRIAVQLNNHTCDVIYDTGASGNVISEELAEKLALPIYGFSGIDIKGVQQVNTKFAIVDSLQLGEIIYTNVPFQVADFNVGHQEADSIRNKINLNCVIGITTMLPLEEIQFDFKNKYLFIPVNKNIPPLYAPNLYISSSGVLVMSAFDKRNKEKVDILLDTGAVNSMLTYKYYMKNKDSFSDITSTDTLRIAGMGGIEMMKTIPTFLEYTIDGIHYIKEPIKMNVEIGKSMDSDAWFGLSSLTKYNKVILNFKDMWAKFSM